MGAPAEFAILRVEKRKTLGAVASLAGHALRDRPTPNADPARTPDNRVLAGAGFYDWHGRSPAEWFEDRDRRLVELKRALRRIGSLAGFREKGEET